jgi:hypothetical protein
VAARLPAGAAADAADAAAGAVHGVAGGAHDPTALLLMIDFCARHAPSARA